MGMEFGWWSKTPEDGKFQVVANFHGGNLSWTRKQGHHTPWQAHAPTDEDWERLMYEAGKRVPRRLMSPKQFAELERLRPT